MLKIIRVLILFPLILGLIPGKPAFGQGGATGAISGTVVDVNGGGGAGAGGPIFYNLTAGPGRGLAPPAGGRVLSPLPPPPAKQFWGGKTGVAGAENHQNQ